MKVEKVKIRREVKVDKVKMVGREGIIRMQKGSYDKGTHSNRFSYLGNFL